MLLHGPSPEAQRRDSTCRHRPVDRAREPHSRDSERSPNVETGAASAGHPPAPTDGEKDVEFEAEISPFQDYKADIRDPIFSSACSDVVIRRLHLKTLAEGVGATPSEFTLRKIVRKVLLSSSWVCA